MSLGREDGAHVGAPYKGGPPVGSLVSDVPTTASAAVPEPMSEPEDEGGSSDGMAVMVSLVGIVFFGAIAFFAYHNRRRWSGAGLHMPRMPGRRTPSKQYDYSNRDCDVLRGWDNGGGDFSYDSRALGGRRGSSSYDASSPHGMGREFSNGSNEWDDRENIRQKAT